MVVEVGGRVLARQAQPIAAAPEGAAEEVLGRDLHRQLVRNGIHSRHLVWRKTGADEFTTALSHYLPFAEQSRMLFGMLERLLSVQSVLYPYAQIIPLLNVFQEANLVHRRIRAHSGWEPIQTKIAS